MSANSWGGSAIASAREIMEKRKQRTIALQIIPEEALEALARSLGSIVASWMRQFEVPVLNSGERYTIQMTM
jgi:hypothetical protein